MNIKVAKTACFCMGVKRAMDMVLDAAANEQQPVFTYGPLIHNPQVLKMLRSRNINVLENLADGKPGSRIIIRTHGVSPETRKKIKDKNFNVSDATCPLVAKVQGTVRRYARKGYNTVIIGDEKHAEIIGLMGFTEGRGAVVKSVEQVKKLPDMEQVCIVGQTTLNRKKYREIANVVKERFPRSIIEETICSATDERQEEVLKLAEEVEAVVVVGGRNSANTNHLAHLAQSTGTPTYHIEKEDELNEKTISFFNTVGVTAGASTPTWMINRVVDRLEEIGRHKKGGTSRFFQAIADFIINSNLYISAGAAMLSFVTPALCGIEQNKIFPLGSFFYFFSMYSLNQYGDREDFGSKKPGRIFFFERHKGFMLGSGFISMLVALGLSGYLGTVPFIIILISTFMGVAYSVKIFPGITCRKMEIRRLKDIPASKDLFVGAAWAAVTVLVPASYSPETGITIPVVTTFFFVFMITYIRSVLFDIRDIQGDRFVGRETIPIIIGLEPTKIFLLVLSAATAFILFFATTAGYVPKAGYLLILPVIYTLFYLYLYHKRIISQGILCDYVVDGTFIITGMAALSSLLT